MSMLARDAFGASIMAIRPGSATQLRTFTNAAAQSAAFGAQTSVIRVIADQICHIRAGADPTATTNDTKIPAGVPEYFAVKSGDKLSVIRASADGTLQITEGENY